ncbi:MAG: polysaccharide deacetylase family sporulation protein PdaB [Firmicutes bacterium]|nr:polysaccharide deacetylase family sporulation protein PdaB [Bacillota bacterium]
MVIIITRVTKIKILAFLGFLFVAMAARPGLDVLKRQLAVSGRLKPIYRVATAENKIALTFDISWGEVTPPLVLNVLKEHRIRATFFLSGPWASTHAEVVKRIVADGHEVGSHGYKHDNLSQLSEAQIAENIEKAHRILKDLVGYEPHFLRPPNGDFDDRVITVAGERGYAVVIWSLDSLDWKNPGLDYMIKKVLGKVQKGDIILFHASDTAKQTHLVLPAILQGLREKGLESVPLSELLPAPSHPDPKTPGPR